MITERELLHNLLERFQAKRQKILDNYWLGWLHKERLACLDQTIEEIHQAIAELQPKKLNAAGLLELDNMIEMFSSE